MRCAAWLDFLGIGTGGDVALTGHFAKKVNAGGGYPFINGWGTEGLPELVANSSDKAVRIPGNMKPHGVAVHPSPTLNAAVGWRSPVSAPMRVEATVRTRIPNAATASPGRSSCAAGPSRQRLATGVAQGASRSTVGPVEHLAIKAGDLVSISDRPPRRAIIPAT